MRKAIDRVWFVRPRNIRLSKAQNVGYPTTRLLTDPGAAFNCTKCQQVVMMKSCMYLSQTRSKVVAAAVAARQYKSGIY